LLFADLDMSSSPVQFAHFGVFAFDLRQRVLTRDGVVVPVAPKDLEILRVLIETPGQIVEKKEIFEKVWPDTFVEEANLSRHVFSLRQIFSRDGQQRTIETVPKRGYRFVAPVRLDRGLIESSAAPLDSTAAEDRNGDEVLHAKAPSIGARNGRTPRPAKGILHESGWPLWFPLLAVLLVVGTMISFVRAKALHKLSIAVLPVQNLTGDASKEYICDGLTEELIAQLGTTNPSELGVVPRTSSMAYKTSAKTARQIAKELDVDYLIEGSLRQSAGRFRFTAQLFRFPEQEHVWTREFDRTPLDLIGMEDEIGQSVARLLADLHSDGGGKIARIAGR
jgi:TolB-like protein/DNA-binding winged helix-turn-helix (wHTH) protein